MPLFLVTVINPAYEPAPVYPDIARGDVWKLLTINGELDGGIGDEDLTTGYRHVTYDQKLAGFGRDLVDFLANVCDRDVIVGATDTSFVFYDPDNQHLYPLNTGVAVTWVADDDSLNMAYDVTQCNGHYWWAVDPSGAKISAPNCIILGHEMCHAMHLCLNDLADNPEVQARTDENKLRSEQSMPLRDVNNGAKGCGLQNPPAGGGFSWSNVCFIVSAAVDGTDVARISRLVHLRDLLMRRSALGRRFFDGLFREYYQFSPRVATDMKALPTLRLAVSELIVKPLVDFWEVLGAYALGDWDLAECDRAFADRVRRFRDAYGQDQDGEARAAEICTYLSEVPSRLESSDCSRLAPRLFESDTAQWRDVFDYVAGVVQPTTTWTYTVWGLLSPLEFYWRAVAGDAPRFVDFVEGWLGAAPIPRVDELAKEPEPRGELDLLERTILRSRNVRLDQRTAAWQ